MVSVEQAFQLILKSSKPIGIEKVALEEACGRILREDVRSDRPQPAFNKALMDGIAIASKAWHDGSRVFMVEAVVPAGVWPKPLKRSNGCVRIMTGAALPLGCDAVVPIERVSFENDHAVVSGISIIGKGDHVAFKASDAKKGDILIKASERLEPPHIGVAASVGLKYIKVCKLLKIAIVSTGNELVPGGFPIKPYQTRMSNNVAIKALLERSQLAEVSMHHVVDDKNRMAAALKKILPTVDMLILSGGVSKGDYDYVPQVLKSLQVKSLFHQVAQKPGKPLWFGLSRSHQLVFGLPGNPVSTLICAYRYILPVLFIRSGLAFKPCLVKLAGQIKPIEGMVQFIPVRLENLKGELFAYPINIHGSSDFLALVKADGFIEYDSQSKESLRPYFSWRP